MLVETSIAALAGGEKVQVSPGDTLRVNYSFRYRIATTVSLWASLYLYSAGILNRVSGAQEKSAVTLTESTEWQDYPGQIDITIGNIGSGSFGLIVEMPAIPGMEAKIDDCIEVVPAPGITEWIGPLIMIAVMGMMMRMMPREE